MRTACDKSTRGYRRFSCGSVDTQKSLTRSTRQQKPYSQSNFTSETACCPGLREASSLSQCPSDSARNSQTGDCYTLRSDSNTHWNQIGKAAMRRLETVCEMVFRGSELQLRHKRLPPK